MQNLSHINVGDFVKLTTMYTKIFSKDRFAMGIIVKITRGSSFRDDISEILTDSGKTIVMSNYWIDKIDHAL